MCDKDYSEAMERIVTQNFQLREELGTLKLELAKAGVTGPPWDVLHKIQRVDWRCDLLRNQLDGVNYELKCTNLSNAILLEEIANLKSIQALTIWKKISLVIFYFSQRWCKT